MTKDAAAEVCEALSDESYHVRVIVGIIATVTHIIVVAITIIKIA